MNLYVGFLPEEYRATAIAGRVIGIALEGFVEQARFSTTQTVIARGDVELFLTLFSVTEETRVEVGHLKLNRGRFEAYEPQRFKLTTNTKLKGGEIFYIEKHVSMGHLALPESLVQIECR